MSDLLSYYVCWIYVYINIEDKKVVLKFHVLRS